MLVSLESGELYIVIIGQTKAPQIESKNNTTDLPFFLHLFPFVLISVIHPYFQIFDTETDCDTKSCNRNKDAYKWR